MATIAFYSLKGGVGKSTLAVNLAWCAATLSARRTLLWDLDAQAAASWMLGDDGRQARAQSIFAGRDEPQRQVRATAWPRLDLLPADASLRHLDHLLQELDKKKRLRRLVSDVDGYDRVMLDCPPGFGEVSEQVARASDLIVVPVIPSPLSQRAYDEVERRFGGKVPLLPVHVMVDRRRLLHVAAVSQHPDWPAIPMASAVEVATARRLPVGVAAPRAPATAAIAHLWRGIERRLG